MSEQTNRVPGTERTGSPKDLFFIWCANNIGILGLVMGAMLTSFGLSLVQGIVAAFLASLSFAMVGYTGIIGKRTGMTTFIMSKETFGVKGNIIPNLIAWINLVGWLCVNVVTGSLILVTLLGQTLGIEGTTSKLVAMLIFVALVLLSGVVKPQHLAKIQTYITYIFGGLTLIMVILLVSQTNWSTVMSLPSGNWLTAFLPAVSIIAAGTGINWTIAGADYSAYQKPTVSDRHVFLGTTFGAMAPLFIILCAGVLIGTTAPHLADASNPIDVIGSAIPSWLSSIYLITAVGGIIPQCIVSLQSAKMNLDALNIKVSQPVSLGFHGILMVGLPFSVLFFANNLLGNFQLFLGLLGIGLASWVAVFTMDYVFNRKAQGYATRLNPKKASHQLNWSNVMAWATGVIIGLLCTSTPFYTGLFAHGIFNGNSLGVFVALIVSGGLVIIQSVIKGGGSYEK